MLEIWGHPGLDWGSGMPYVAYVPALNITYAMGINSYMGQNQTLLVGENKNTQFFWGAFCRAMAPVLRLRAPQMPPLACSSID